MITMDKGNEDVGAAQHSIQAAVTDLETFIEKMGAVPVAGHEPETYVRLGVQLKNLHVELRTFFASEYLSERYGEAELAAPELSEDADRLRAEHPNIIGRLDRLIRSTDTIVDRTLEDQSVLFFSVRELAAVIRRHRAEQDRLLHLAIWRDTGGEA